MGASAASTTESSIFKGRMAEPVVSCAFLAVFQRVVGFIDFLEFRFSFRIAWIAVWVELHRHFAVSAFQRLVVRITSNSQNFIEITFRHQDLSVLSCRWLPLSLSAITAKAQGACA
jgi:hypothetical protein